MWVHLQILAICLERQPQSVRNALATLPKGLDETYLRILKSIAENESPSTVSAVDLVLKWILYGEELCSPELIIGSLAVKPGEAAPDTHRWTLTDILNICHNFVVYDKELNTLRFAHFSVQEFLTRQPKFEREGAHTTIAEGCLTVLTYESAEDSCPTPALLQYSTRHWAVHVRLAGGGSDTLTGLWKAFLTPPLASSRAYKAWGAAVIRHSKAYNPFRPLCPSEHSSVIHPLWVVCYYQLYDIFKFLLGNDAVGDCYNECMDTPLTHASAMGYTEFVKLLTERPDVDLYSRNSDGLTPLLLAARQGHEMVVQILLEKEVNPDSEGNDGRTALSQAAREGHEGVVQILLERGVDPDSRDLFDWSPLSFAAACGRKKVMQILLEKGVDPNPGSNVGYTPLALAVAHNHDESVRVLLEHVGVDLNCRRADSGTPLMAAAGNGYEKVLQALLEKEGVYRELRCKDGMTALSYAAKMGRAKCVEMLLEKGVDPDPKDVRGRTPLSYAVEGGEKAITQMLLEKGAGTDRAASGDLSVVG